MPALDNVGVVLRTASWGKGAAFFFIHAWEILGSPGKFWGPLASVLGLPGADLGAVVKYFVESCEVLGSALNNVGAVLGTSWGKGGALYILGKSWEILGSPAKS